MSANTKRPRDEEETATSAVAGAGSGNAGICGVGGDAAEVEDKRAKQLCFVAKKSVTGNLASAVEVSLASDATVVDLASRIADHEGCQATQVMLVCKGAVLRTPSAPLLTLAEQEGGAKVVVVYIVQKPASAIAAAPAGGVVAVAPAANGAGSAAGAAAAPDPSSAGPSAGAAKPATSGDLAGANGAAIGAAGQPGVRVILFMRHGQCCHEDEGDELKSLTDHGHKQAEHSARFVAKLFADGSVPSKRALLHSTSRRARETAAKLPSHLPGVEVWNADILRETNPSSNPLRAEEVFHRLFVAPQEGESFTLVVVAHNNIILYLLMRAAGAPIERAAQAWRLFHLRHASVTKVEVRAGVNHIVSIGAAGHVPHEDVTWNNIRGADMSAWKGGRPERHKFSGRMVILVRQAAAQANLVAAQNQLVAAHVKGLGEYMVSGHMTVVCTSSAQSTAAGIAKLFRTAPQVFPDSIAEHPEAASLEFFKPPQAHSRDTICMVADDGPVLYWLLRALMLSPEEAKAATGSYCIGHASVTLINIKSDGMMKVVTVGDTGHLDGAPT